MKRTVIGLLLAMAVLSGCGGYGIDVIPKFEKARQTIPDSESVKQQAEQILSDIGVESFEFLDFGNYEDTLKYIVDGWCSIDLLYKVDKTAMIVNATYSDEDGWYISKVINASDHSRKCYYLGADDERQADLYEYGTDKLIEAGMSMSEKMDQLEEKTGMKIDRTGISSTIRTHVDTTYDNTTINDIAVNDDASNEGKHIAIVRLKWDFNNSAQTAKDLLKTYSDDLAATIAKKHLDVSEIAIMWETPQQGGSGSKLSYSCRDGGAYPATPVWGF